VVVSVGPSLDTPVCSIQTKRFNEEAVNLGADVEVSTVSMDLPFAQQRWCGAEGVDRVRTLSDHRDAAFGTAWGLLIGELRLLARAVFVVDANGDIQYVQLVKEITDEPDYADVLQAVKKIKG
jgi:thiol peroxidase